MTDHAEVRRDAEQLLRELQAIANGFDSTLNADETEVFSQALHALLAELAQAERERDEWMTPFDGSGIEWHEGLPSPYTYQASDFSKLVAAVHEYECVAASVPALVEALRQYVEYEGATPLAREALTVYEQSQGGSSDGQG